MLISIFLVVSDPLSQEEMTLDLSQLSVKRTPIKIDSVREEPEQSQSPSSRSSNKRGNYLNSNSMFTINIDKNIKNECQ